jgi:hypothetical protein
MAGTSAPTAASGPDRSPGLLSALTSLPWVSQTLNAITTFNIGPVTELLEEAGFLPLLLVADSRRVGDGFEVTAAPRRFAIATGEAPDGPGRGPSAIRAINRVGAPAASLRCRWRVVPEDYVGHAGDPAPLPALPLLPGAAQRIEITEWDLAFLGSGSGYRAYGTGRTLPGAGGGPAPGGAGFALGSGGAGVGGTGGGMGAAFVLDVLEGRGQLAGLPGTVVAAGSIGPDGRLDLTVLARFMVPLAPGAAALAEPPAAPLAPGAAVAAPGATAAPSAPAAAAASWPAASFPAASGEAAAGGTTCLAFAGQIDPSHPVKLRLSLTEGFLGSFVYELLRTATLDFETAGAGAPGGGTLRAGARRGGLVGSVAATLSFDPLSLCPVLPIQTRAGIFELHDAAGRSLGTVTADMTEGRSFRTRVAGQLLPVFRFGGFGPIQGGTGEFAGARGIMCMDSVISVQPRTLANLYVLSLADPDGRYRAPAGAIAFAQGVAP